MTAVKLDYKTAVKFILTQRDWTFTPQVTCSSFQFY